MMKLLRAFFAVAVFSPSLFAGTIPGLSSKTLDNGLDVIVVENHAVPLVTVEIAVRSGSFVETPEFSGLSHLYEHMFFKANKVIPSAEKYQERLNELGASWNGTTNTERVNYFLTVPAENTREATAFLRDALYSPLFGQKELERERVVVLGEFDRAEANPQFHLAREVDRKLWKNFSRKNVIGDRDVIVTTPREKMITLKERYYVPNNSAVLFSGDIKPEEAFALASEFFGDWKRTQDPHAAYPEPEQPALTQSSTIAVIQPVKSVTLQQTWHGPSMKADTPSTFAADVFSFIISQPNSRFYKKLVDSGAFDNASLGYFSQAHTGPINFFATTSADRFDRAFAAWRDELRHLADNDYFTDEELKFAKDQLEVSEIYGRERPSQFIHTVSFWWSSAGLDYYEDYLDNLRKVSRADVQNYLRRYVIGKPSVTGVLASETDLPKLTAIKTAEIVKPAKGSSATAMSTTATETVKTEMFDVDGLRVVLRNNPQSEVVAAEAFLEGGTAFSGPQRAGLESLLLTIAHEQSEKYPKEKMARELTRLGSQINAGTPAVDYSTLNLTSLRRNFGPSLDIFLDALFRPRIDEAALKLARDRRLTALARQEENPDSYLTRLALENAFPNHPYALDPLGTRERITSTTVSDLQKLRAETLNRSRVLLVVVGNITKDELTNMIRPALQGVPRGEFKKPVVDAMPAADRATTKMVTRDLPTVYVRGFFGAPSIAAADYPAMYVGMSILGTRLFQEVRIKRNLSYAPGASVAQRMSNYGSLYVSTPNPNAAIKVIQDEVRKMQTSPLSQNEVHDAALAARTRLLQNLEASADIADIVGRFTVATGDPQSFDTFLARITAVTPEEVRQAMDKYAHRVDFALLGNVKDVDQSLLTSF